MAANNSTELPPRVKDETGNIHNKLTVLNFVELRSPKGAFWLCQCECGNLATVSGISLRKGNTKSCGCLYYSQNGEAGTPEHRIWKDMKRRCYSPQRSDYYLYGGCGITVCARWRTSFVNFLADMGPRPSAEHSIDRINNDGNYEPGNVRWASRIEQAQNKRNTLLITYNGETLCIAEWARRVGIQDATLYYRFKRGWSIEDAMTIPPIKGSNCH